MNVEVVCYLTENEVLKLLSQISCLWLMINVAVLNFILFFFSFNDLLDCAN